MKKGQILHTKDFKDLWEIKVFGQGLMNCSFQRTQKSIQKEKKNNPSAFNNFFQTQFISAVHFTFFFPDAVLQYPITLTCSINHSMIEWLGLGTQSGPNPCSSMVAPNQFRLPRAPPSPALLTYREGAPTALWTTWAISSSPLSMELLPNIFIPPCPRI